MSDGSSSRAPWIVPIVVAFISSPVWGSAICRAVGVCDGQPTPPPTIAPATPPPTSGFTFPTFSFPDFVEANIFLSVLSGPAGSTIKVSGEGFQPNESVVFTMQTIEVGRTTASPAGSFSGVEITVPDDLAIFAPKQYFVDASGQSSVKHARAAFMVSG